MDRFKTEEELLNEKYARELELAKDDKELKLNLEAEYLEKLAELGENNSIDAIAERFMTEQELLQAKLDKELEIIGDNNDLKLKLLAEFEENTIKVKKNAADKEQKVKDDQAKKD